MDNFRKVSILSIVPIEEEQIIAEREIICKISKQLENDKIFTINIKTEEEPPPYEETYYKHSKHLYQHKHCEHQEDHTHHKQLHHQNHKQHDHHKPNKHHDPHDYQDHHKHDKHQHEKKHKKFEGRPRNEELDPNGPKDKYHCVRIMFFILGVIHVLPYTFFTTANEYWMYKFRDTTINSTDANDRTYLQANFASLSNLISVGPSTACQFLLTFFGHKIRAKTRIMFTLMLHSFVFVLQAAFVKINTDDWQVGFFYLTMASMTLISCSMSLGSTGNMVTISQFPDQYLKMYLVGEFVAGLCTSIMRLISIVATPNTVASALMYFLTGSVIMIVPTICFYFSTRLKFFRYYTRNMKKSTRKRIPTLSDLREILIYTWPVLLLNTLTYIIPHSTIANLVVSEYYGTDSVWGTKYFVTCCTYLLPAVTAIIGRLIFYKFELNLSMIVLSIAICLQVLTYTPFMLFVNAKPRSHLPVLFPHDWQYALIIGLQYLIYGYTSNMLSMKSLRLVPQEKLELSWLVNLFVFKLITVASSPMGLLIISLL